MAGHKKDAHVVQVVLANGGTRRAGIVIEKQTKAKLPLVVHAASAAPGGGCGVGSCPGDALQPPAPRTQPKRGRHACRCSCQFAVLGVVSRSCGWVAGGPHVVPQCAWRRVLLVPLPPPTLRCRWDVAPARMCSKCGGRQRCPVAVLRMQLFASHLACAYDPPPLLPAPPGLPFRMFPGCRGGGGGVWKNPRAT